MTADPIATLMKESVHRPLQLNELTHIHTVFLARTQIQSSPISTSAERQVRWLVSALKAAGRYVAREERRDLLESYITIWSEFLVRWTGEGCEPVLEDYSFHRAEGAVPF